MLNPIKKARIIKGLQQKQFADLLGVSPVAVSKWECGKAFPRVTRLKQIADVLDTSVENLLMENNGKGG